MADPSLVLQQLIGDRLAASADVTAMVPADNILDTSGRPERSPCILIGEGQTVYRNFHSVAYSSLHVWVQEPGLALAKEIVSAIVDVLPVDAQSDGALHLDGFICHDLSVNETRYMRDPHGPYSHAVVTVAAVMKETA